MNLHPNTIPIGSLLAIVVIAWRVVRALNRFEMILEEYPPHRHINGHILYPKGQTPDKAQSAGAGR